MTKTYQHTHRDGRVVVVRQPKGSIDEPMTVRENVLGILAGAALRRLAGRR